jgi:thioredoxin 1
MFHVEQEPRDKHHRTTATPGDEEYMSELKHVTDASFQKDVLENGKPVLVDFWAPWCGPCRMIAPILDQIASEHDELEIVKVNIDENPEIATKYGVLNIPMLNVYVKGEVAKTIVGAKPKRALLNDLQDFIAVK